MQKEKKYEFDNAPFMPGWWAQQLEETESHTVQEQQQNWQPNH